MPLPYRITLLRLLFFFDPVPPPFQFVTCWGLSAPYRSIARSRPERIKPIAEVWQPAARDLSFSILFPRSFAFSISRVFVYVSNWNLEIFGHPQEIS